VTKRDLVLDALHTDTAGHRSWDELLELAHTTPQALARIAYQLQRDGLVELMDWDGSVHRRVRLTASSDVDGEFRPRPASTTSKESPNMSPTSTSTPAPAGNHYAFARSTGIRPASHAVRPDEVPYVLVGPSDDATVLVHTLCATTAELLPGSDWFDQNNPAYDDRCPDCVWAVAIAEGKTDQQLEALRPPADELEALSRLVDTPLIAYRLCKAILADAPRDEAGSLIAHPFLIALLARVTAHAPMILMPSPCSDRDCDHDGPCPSELASAACPTCSLVPGPWSGHDEAEYFDLYTVPAPCSVIAKLATTISVPGASRQAITA
jgi:hypothetical protein